MSDVHILREPADKGQDRVLFLPTENGWLCAVADGAGETGQGDIASEFVCESIRTAAKGEIGNFAALLIEIDDHLSRHPSGGQSTAVIVQLSGQHLRGASVGDSEAWLIPDAETVVDLTSNQRKKPLLGTGVASPMPFGPVRMGGRLVVGTDGLFKYLPRDFIRETVSQSTTLEKAAVVLRRALQYRSGAFPDDIAMFLYQAARRPRGAKYPAGPRKAPGRHPAP